MKLILTLLSAAALLAQASVTLERAIRKETLEGDLKGAIALFEKALKEARNDRATAAKALLQLAECHQKMGDAKARGFYEQLVRDYGDQKEQVAVARMKLGVAVTAGTQRRIPIGDVQQCSPWNVSADGKLLGATEYSTANIGVIDAVTGECRELTKWGSWSETAGYADQGAISRDGKWMAAWHYAGKNNGEIRIVGTDGSGERTIYVGRHSKDSQEWGVPLNWSPDGKLLLVALSHSASKGVSTFEIATVAVADGSLRILHSFEYAGRIEERGAFSPDGKYVAWSEPQASGSKIYSKPVGGGGVTTVSALGVFEGWPDDGLVFWKREGGKSALYSMPVRDGAAAGTPVLIRETSPGEFIVGISARGTIFGGERIPRVAALSATLNTTTGELGQPQLIAPKSANRAYAATWSKDGRWLSYLRVGPFRYGSRLMIRDMRDGGERELVLSNMGLAGGPRMFWSADTKFIYGEGESAGVRGLYRIDVQSGESTRIDQGCDNREVAPDGESFYRRGGPGNRQIRAVNIATSESRVVFQSDEEVGSIALSLDGKRIAIASGEWKDDRPGTLRVVDLAAGTVRKLDEGWYQIAGSNIAWSPDGRYLLVRSQRGTKNRESLALIPVDGGSVKEVAGTGLSSSTRINALAFLPDGKGISWTSSRPESHYWAIEK
ncbi:MAG: hypothetical protein FJW38_08710 [Acidobacteria bacterium]|nr:hypothetical protein [Acidobacteriota bacterium]